MDFCRVITSYSIHYTKLYEVTWIVDSTPHLPPLLTGGRATIAVRVSDHPIVRRLCLRTGHALVSTSANFAGRPPARSALEVRRAATLLTALGIGATVAIFAGVLSYNFV